MRNISLLNQNIKLPRLDPTTSFLPRHVIPHLGNPFGIAQLIQSTPNKIFTVEIPKIDLIDFIDTLTIDVQFNEPITPNTHLTLTSSPIFEGFSGEIRIFNSEGAAVSFPTNVPGQSTQAQIGPGTYQLLLNKATAHWIILDFLYSDYSQSASTIFESVNKSTETVQREQDKRLEDLEAFGVYIGAFETRALLPTNANTYTPPSTSNTAQITINDFALVLRDETNLSQGTPTIGLSTVRPYNIPLVSLYRVSAINSTGTITWVRDGSLDTDALVTRFTNEILRVESLGTYQGIYPTRASLPTNTSDMTAFPNGATIQDFILVRNDETRLAQANPDKVARGHVTCYKITNINSNGDITWTFQSAFVDEVLITEIQNDIVELYSEIARLESLGNYVGAFDNRAAPQDPLGENTILPTNISEFDFVVTVNDFATVREDETQLSYAGNPQTTRYVILAVDDVTGDITWNFDLVYSTDLSGKVDKVPSAVSGNIAVFDNAGNIRDSGRAESLLDKTIDGIKFNQDNDVLRYNICETHQSDPSKDVLISGFVEQVGARVTVKFIRGNSHDEPTLDIWVPGATGPMVGWIRQNGLPFSDLRAGMIYDFVYTADGVFEVVSAGGGSANIEIGPDLNTTEDIGFFLELTSQGPGFGPVPPPLTEGTVKSVNLIEPDSAGDVQITASDILESDGQTIQGRQDSQNIAIGGLSARTVNSRSWDHSGNLLLSSDFLPLAEDPRFPSFAPSDTISDALANLFQRTEGGADLTFELAGVTYKWNLKVDASGNLIFVYEEI